MTVYFVQVSDILVVNGARRLVTYREWNDLLQESFEKCYYVPLSKSNLRLSIANPR